MTSKNRHYLRSKISEAKFHQIVRHFALDLTATECASARHWPESLKLTNPTLVHGYVANVGGTPTYSKTIVFGLLKRGDCVSTEIVPNASKATLQAIIRGKANINSIIHTDSWRDYDGLADIGFDKHFRVNHGHNAFVREKHHLNGIESFWSFAKRRLAQFNGIL